MPRLVDRRTTATEAWPDHLLRLDEWEALDGDPSHCMELVEGVLHITPRPVFDHQYAVLKLGAQVDEQLTDELAALPEVDVVLFDSWPPTVRMPDLVVVPRGVARAGPVEYHAEDVRLVVEVVSPGSVRTDRIVKLAEYADAGIQDYWIVDLQQPASIATFTLEGGRYVSVGQSAAEFTLQTPVPLSLEPAALLPQR